MQRPLIVHGVSIVTGDEAGTLDPDGALAERPELTGLRALPVSS